MPSIRYCVDTVKKKSGLTEAQAHEVLRRTQNHWDRMVEQGVSPEDRAGALMQWAEEQALNVKRDAAVGKHRAAQQVLAGRKFTDNTAAVASELEAVGNKTPRSTSAFSRMVGITENIPNARQSIDANTIGLELKFMKAYATALDGTPGLRRQIGGFAGIRRMRDLRANVAREMHEFKPDGKPGVTKDKEALIVAKALSANLEVARQWHNKAGGNIGKLEGYTPQTHNSGKITRAGLDVWTADVLSDLDLARTFPDLVRRGFDPDELDARMRVILADIYTTITTGIGPEAPLRNRGAQSFTSSLTRRYEHSRVLHFQDADAWVVYNDKYGQGDVVDASLRRLRGMARDIALMRELGPSPELNLTRRLGDMTQETRNDPDLSDKARANEIQLLNPELIRTRDGKLGHAFAEVMGETYIPAHLTWAKIGSGARSVSSMIFLGRAMISSIVDVAVVAHRVRHNGAGLLDSWGRAIESVRRGHSTPELRERTEVLSAMSDGMLGSTHSRFDAADSVPGAISQAQGLFHKLSYLTGWTDRIRTGYVYGIAKEMALRSGQDFNGLPPRYRAMLQRHGVSEAQWGVLRRMSAEAPDGRTYVLPETAQTVPDEVVDAWIVADAPQARAIIEAQRPERMSELRQDYRDRAEIDLIRLFRDEADFAVIEPRAAERVIMRRGSHPGTLVGELLPTILQFKSFPIAFYRKLIHPRVREIGRGGPESLSAVASLAALVLETTALGYVAMTTKQLLDGKEPRDFFRDPQEVFIASMLQGGGMGIFGDFLFGEYNRFGRGWAETALGPILGSIGGDVMSLFASAREGDIKAGKALGLALRYTPFVNLWWTRQAWNYLIAYQAQEMLSPGTLRRRERNLAKFTGQEYFLPPSSVVERGGGFR